MSHGWQSKAQELAEAVTQASAEITKLAPRTLKLAASPSSVVSAVEQFQECVRYLNTRRSKGAIINIDGEDVLQDVLFLMLRPWVTDLVPENPSEKAASRFNIKDFSSKQNDVVVEAKFIRDKRHGKDISKELYDDIETYRNHPNCSHIIFFIYDPDAWIPDVAALRRQIEVTRTYNGKTLRVHCVVKP